MKTADKPITVEMGAGYMSATLRIDPFAEDSDCDARMCTLQLTEANVRLTSEIARRVEAYVEQWRAGENREQPLVLEATPPVNGKNGYVQWDPACDPAQLDHKLKPVDGKVDFYSTRNFIDVGEGQLVATIIPPTEGEVGYDLRGEVIPAKAGQPSSVRFDPKSFEINSEGQCRAKMAGVLRIVSRDVSISPVLYVAENVDFSSGNIEFIGDVSIGGAVCDCFSVKADGNVEVKGTIEAATVEVGGDLHAKNGIATRGQGHVRVGRDLHTKYMNSVKAVVGRDVLVEREIMGSEVVVERNLSIPRGSLIGGPTIVRGVVQLQTLGSDGELPTKLVLAYSPKVQRMIDSIQDRLRRIETEKKQAAQRVQEIQSMSDPSHALREELTTMMCKPYELDGVSETLQQRLTQVKTMYVRTRTVDLKVDKMIYAGVELVVDGNRFIFRESLKGPVWIRWDENRKVVCETPGGVERLLSEVPGVQFLKA